MTLTRIWGSLLVLMASAFLAGMFMLAAGGETGFSEGEKKAVEAVTNAGTAALTAELESSPVGLGPTILKDASLAEHLRATAAGEELGEEAPNLQTLLFDVANETLLKDHALMSVAIVDKDGQILARTGMEETLFPEVVTLTAFQKADDAATRFSATLGGRLYAVQLARRETSTAGRRLVAIQTVDISGESMLRRVLGENPAGLVRKGVVVGEPMGGANKADLSALIKEHEKDVPPSDAASQVFEIGKGANQRLGSIARVPGPAGRGKEPTYLVVLSPHSLGLVSQDLGSALSSAKANGMGKVPWPIVAGMLLLGLALVWYLPHMEHRAPLRRLAAELDNIFEGKQAQLFHDTYKGDVGVVARATANTQEGLRQMWEAELAEADDEDQDGEAAPRSRRPRTSSSRRRSTRSRPVARRESEEAPAAIELPDAPEDAALESHMHSDGEAAPEPEAAASGVSLGGDFGLGIDGGAPAPFAPEDDAPALDAPNFGGPTAVTPTPTPAPAPVPQTATPTPPPPAEPDDPEEAYFRQVYDEFVQIKQTCGEDTENFQYEKFARKLRRNREQLLQRPGVRDVEFTVYIKDGKAALKAKVVK
jgi:hypothetical protein